MSGSRLLMHALLAITCLFCQQSFGQEREESYGSYATIYSDYKCNPTLTFLTGIGNRREKQYCLPFYKLNGSALKRGTTQLKIAVPGTVSIETETDAYVFDVEVGFSYILEKEKISVYRTVDLDTKIKKPSDSNPLSNDPNSLRKHSTLLPVNGKFISEIVQNATGLTTSNSHSRTTAVLNLIAATHALEAARARGQALVDSIERDKSPSNTRSFKVNDIADFLGRATGSERAAAVGEASKFDAGFAEKIQSINNGGGQANAEAAAYASRVKLNPNASTSEKAAADAYIGRAVRNVKGAETLSELATNQANVVGLRSQLEKAASSLGINPAAAVSSAAPTLGGASARGNGRAAGQ